MWERSANLLFLPFFPRTAWNWKKNWTESHGNCPFGDLKLRTESWIGVSVAPWIKVETRMHSSMMRTVCSSSRLSRGLPQCMLGYQLPPPQEQAPPNPGPGTLQEQAPPPREQTPPPPCAQTHTRKDITFATSLRTVKNGTNQLFSFRISFSNLCTCV